MLLSKMANLGYESLSDEPLPYKPPDGIELSGTGKEIVEVGKVVDGLVTHNLKLLLERTVCQGRAPKLTSGELGDVIAPTDEEKESIERVFGSDRPDFAPMLATCCSAKVLGKTTELSPKKSQFLDFYRPWIDLKIEELRQRCPELPAILSYAAYAVCYGRYLEHGGKIGLLVTPYLGYVRLLNRKQRLDAYRWGRKIDEKCKSNGRIFEMFDGLISNQFFTPISDKPNVFKIPDLVLRWFARNLPLP